MTYCPVCQEVCVEGSLKTGVYKCSAGHKWYKCRRCRQLKINQGDNLGLCVMCDGSTIDDRMLSYHQSPHLAGGARLGIMNRPDTFENSRRGGRIDDERVTDFVFYRPSSGPSQRSRDISFDQKVDFRPMPSGIGQTKNRNEVLQPRATVCYADSMVAHKGNPFETRMIPMNTVYE